MMSRDHSGPIYYCGGCGDKLQEKEPKQYECEDCGVIVRDKKKEVIHQ